MNRELFANEHSGITTMIVAKVGGSLFDWAALPAALRAWLANTTEQPAILFPGGGVTADAIRAFDQTFQLGEEISHWLAIRTLSVNARVLAALLPDIPLIDDAYQNEIWRGSRILDPLTFFQRDESKDDHLPHTWDVTSDSLALRLAIVLQATELVLLKSTDTPFTNWNQASELGVVDKYFATAMQSAPANRGVRVVNLRRWHAEQCPEPAPPVPSPSPSR